MVWTKVRGNGGLVRSKNGEMKVWLKTQTGELRSGRAGTRGKHVLYETRTGDKCGREIKSS